MARWPVGESLSTILMHCNLFSSATAVVSEKIPLLLIYVNGFLFSHLLCCSLGLYAFSLIHRREDAF